MTTFWVMLQWNYRYTMKLQRNFLTPSVDITGLMMQAAGFSVLVQLPNYTASQLSSVTNVGNCNLTNQDKAAQYIHQILLDVHSTEEKTQHKAFSFRATRTSHRGSRDIVLNPPERTPVPTE